jgi:hypothetical protein
VEKRYIENLKTKTKIAKDKIKAVEVLIKKEKIDNTKIKARLKKEPSSQSTKSLLNSSKNRLVKFDKQKKELQGRIKGYEKEAKDIKK